MVFVVTLEKASSRGFILNSIKRPYVLLKMLLGIFKVALRLRDWHVFLCYNHWGFER